MADSAAIVTLKKNLLLLCQSCLVRTGYYQTGETSAVACDVFVVDEVSACGGGEACSLQRIGLPVPTSCHGSQGASDADSSSHSMSRSSRF